MSSDGSRALLALVVALIGAFVGWGLVGGSGRDVGRPSPGTSPAPVAPPSSPSAAIDLAVPPQVLEAYREGCSLVARGEDESFERGVELLARAAALAPDWAPAHLALGEARLEQGGRPNEVMPLARDAFERALALDPRLAEAHLGRALVARDYDWDLAASRAGFLRARELGLDSVEWHQGYGLLLVLSGELEAARGHLETAMRLEPGSARLHGDLGWLHALSGDHRAALRECRLALALEPGDVGAYQCLVTSHRALGEGEEAMAAARRVMELRGMERGLVARLVMLSADGALRVFDRWQLDWLVERSRETYVPPGALGLAAAGAGDLDTAFARFAEALTERSSILLYLELSPQLAALRADPRYAGLAAQVGEEVHGRSRAPW